MLYEFDNAIYNGSTVFRELNKMKYLQRAADFLRNDLNKYLFHFTHDNLSNENYSLYLKKFEKDQFLIKNDQIKLVNLENDRFYCFYDKKELSKNKDFFFEGTLNANNYKNEIICKGIYLPFIEGKITGLKIERNGLSLGKLFIDYGISKNLLLFTQDLSGCSLFLLFSKTHIYFIHSNLKSNYNNEVDVDLSRKHIINLSKKLGCYKIKELNKTIYFKNLEHLRSNNILSCFACILVEESLFSTKDEINIFYQVRNDDTNKILATGLV